MSAEPAAVTPGLDIDLARQRVLERVEPIAQAERVGLAAAWRRVLAEDLRSPIDVPAYDNSAMDGIACRFDDLSANQPSQLTIAGASLAGHPWQSAVTPGCAIRIMTGALLPACLDTIVPQELCRFDGNRVHVPAGQVRGQHRRRAGEDIGRGAIALPRGQLLSSADLGLAASLGVAELNLVRRPTVALFSTGDELLEPGQANDPLRIYDSNRFTLTSLLRDIGLAPLDLGIVPDRPAALEQALERCADHDLIISSGGVSVGEADHTREVMRRFGQVEFATLAIRPGRPLAFGRVGKAWYFGLPGNPVAVMVTYLFLVRSAIYALMGARPPALLTVPAIADEPIRKRPGRTEYQRAIATPDPQGKLHVRLTGQQGSGVLSSMSVANCMLILRSDRGSVAVGDTVEIALFNGLC